MSVRPAQLAPFVRLAAGATIAAFGVGKVLAALEAGQPAAGG